MAVATQTYIPTDRQPNAFSIAGAAAVQVINPTHFELLLLVGLNLSARVPAQSNFLFAGLANITNLPGWLLVSPRLATLRSYSAADQLSAPPISITTYGGADPLPAVGSYSPGSLCPTLPKEHDFFDPIRTGLPFNVRDWGAAGDGVSDDTAAVAACRACANALGGGEVFWPSGNYVVSPQSIYNNVEDNGSGKGCTIITLKAGSNADLFGAFQANINLTGAGGTGPDYTNAVRLFAFRYMTLDGNYANQSGGPCYPLRFYGLAYTLENLEVRNGYSGGILADYYGPFPSTGSGPAGAGNPWVYEATWINVTQHHALGTATAIGIEKGGPTDSRFTNVLSYHNNSHSFHSAINNGGLQITGSHMWQSGLADPNSCCWLQESSCYASGCEAEGDPHAQFVALNTEIVWNGGSIFAGNAAGLGLQIGQQAGLTPYTNSARQSGGVTTAFAPFTYVFKGVLLMNIQHASGHIWFANDAGDATIDAIVLASVGTQTIYSGTPATQTRLDLTCHGFTDARKQIVQFSGEIAYGQSGASDPGTGGTISTAGFEQVLVNPAAAETGVILQAGTRRGQSVAVVNISTTNSITFAAVGTSNVADGVSDVISPNTTALYRWELGLNHWYRVKAS